MNQEAGSAAPSTKKACLISLRKQAERTGKDWLDIIHDQNPKALTADGFDSCILGLCQRFGWEPVVAYDYDKCVDLLVRRDGMTHEDAVEFMVVNVTGAWVGDGTPVFISTQL